METAGNERLPSSFKKLPSLTQQGAQGPADDPVSRSAVALVGPTTDSGRPLPLAPPSHRYDFQNELGEGSSAKVWKVFDRQTNKHVAIKEFGQFEGSKIQCEREVSTLKLLNACDTQGENMVRMLDTFVHDINGKSCIVMEYLPGKTLRQIIRDSKGVQETNEAQNSTGVCIAVIRKIALDLMKSLRFLSTNEVLHGDIKPENIIIEFDANGKVSQTRVIDFGLAFKTRTAPKRNLYIQSRWYRSPEVLLGIPATPQIDMWSVGCVLIEMFCGICPFCGTDSYDQMLLIMDAVGLPSERLRKSCEEVTLETVDEISKIVTRRWQKLLSYAVGQTRSAQETEKRLREKLLQRRRAHYKVSNESDAELEAFVDLVAKLLRLDPYERFSPNECLHHPFLNSHNDPLDKVKPESDARMSHATIKGKVPAVETRDAFSTGKRLSRSLPMRGMPASQLFVCQRDRCLYARQSAVLLCFPFTCFRSKQSQGCFS
jgi:serine/threonine protein kinase